MKLSRCSIVYAQQVAKRVKTPFLRRSCDHDRVI